MASTTRFIRGIDGNVMWGASTVARVVEWTMKISPRAAEQPIIGSSGVRREYTGVVDFTGTIRMQKQIDTGTTSPQESMEDMFAVGFGTPLKLSGNVMKPVLKLIESSQSMWYGRAVFSNISKTQNAENIQEFVAEWGCDAKFQHDYDNTT